MILVKWGGRKVKVGVEEESFRRGVDGWSTNFLSSISTYCLPLLQLWQRPCTGSQATTNSHCPSYKQQSLRDPQQVFHPTGTVNNAKLQSFLRVFQSFEFPFSANSLNVWLEYQASCHGFIYSSRRRSRVLLCHPAFPVSDQFSVMMQYCLSP